MTPRKSTGPDNASSASMASRLKEDTISSSMKKRQQKSVKFSKVSAPISPFKPHSGKSSQFPSSFAFAAHNKPTNNKENPTVSSI